MYHFIDIAKSFFEILEIFFNNFFKWFFVTVTLIRILFNFGPSPRHSEREKERVLFDYNVEFLLLTQNTLTPVH